MNKYTIYDFHIFYPSFDVAHFMVARNNKYKQVQVIFRPYQYSNMHLFTTSTSC
jgi:hypothetical protein